MADFKTALEALAAGKLELDVLSYQLEKLLQETPKHATRMLAQLEEAAGQNKIDAKHYATLKGQINQYRRDHALETESDETPDADATEFAAADNVAQAQADAAVGSEDATFVPAQDRSENDAEEATVAPNADADTDADAAAADDATQMLGDDATVAPNADVAAADDATQILGDDATQILGDDSQADTGGILDLSSPTGMDTLADDATQILGDDSTQILGDDSTQILADDSTQILGGDSTQILGDDAQTDSGGILDLSSASGTDWQEPQQYAGYTPGKEFGPGDIIKQRFKLLKVLGIGGMGKVYMATDLLKEEARDKKPNVAIKLLNDDFKDHPEAFISLQRESSRQQKLAHPNIATIYDFDRVGGKGTPVFITMELMEGMELKDFIKKKVKKQSGLPFEEALDIVKQLGDGLIYAHDRRLVHSKPGDGGSGKNAV